MRVNCIATYPDDATLALLGPDFYERQGFAVTRGKEYLILGIFFASGDPFGRGPWIVFEDDTEGYGQAPLGMFEIIESAVSKYWQVELFENGAVAIGPLSFNRPFYMEDFWERVPEIVADFKKVRDSIAAEFEDKR